MAKIKEITVNYHRVINLGDFNSLRLSVSPTIEIEDGDDLDKVMHDVWEMCRKNIEFSAQPIINGYKPNQTQAVVTTKEYYLGLPIEEEIT